MKYIILILIVMRITHLLAIHNFYRGLNREKFKQYKNNYIAIITKDIIIVLLFTELFIFIKLIYIFLDKLVILFEKIINVIEKVMDIVDWIWIKEEKLERFIVRKILKLLFKEVKE